MNVAKLNSNFQQKIAVNILKLNDTITTLREFICKMIEISVHLWQFFKFTKKRNEEIHIWEFFYFLCQNFFFHNFLMYKTLCFNITMSIRGKHTLYH